MTEKGIVKIGFTTAFSIVVANMIGTGVFTSLGFQLESIQSVFALLMLWLVGGLIALSGALSYSEISTSIPRSGGEYHLLSKIYHPAIGFMAGWISLLVGFSAPTALASMAMASYAKNVFDYGDPAIFAISVVIIISIIHSFQIRIGGSFQRIVTFLKISLIILFIGSGILLVEPQNIDLIPNIDDFKALFSRGFAVSLIFVSYAFSGWNATVYILDELKDPRKTIPASLFTGTVVVTVLYLLLNFVFLLTSPMEDLVGKIEVGFISANNIFGLNGGKIMAMFISLLLISTISAMIWIGPRVSQVMGEDLVILKYLSKTNKNRIPVRAIWIQTMITIFLIVSSTFDQVLVYAGYVLNIFTLLTVLGVFILRIKSPNLKRPYKVFAYPITPLLFVLLSLWILVYLTIDKPVESFYGILTVLSGLIFYFINGYFEKRKKIQ